MAVAITGTVYEITISGSSSQSVTVPADAELALVLVGGYGQANWVDGGASQDANVTGWTIASVNLKLGHSTDDSSTYNSSCIMYLKSPTTGSQTFAWSVGTFSYGTIYVVFLKGVATSSYVKARGGAQAFGTASTGSMDAASGDLALAVAGADSIGSWTNATGYENDTAHADMATVAPSAAVTISYGTSNNPGVSGIVIAQGAGGGGTPGTWDATISFA